MYASLIFSMCKQPCIMSGVHVRERNSVGSDVGGASHSMIIVTVLLAQMLLLVSD